MWRTPMISAFLSAAAAACLDGMYVQPEISHVPVARLVSNLERELAAKPADAEVHLKLARLYGMAYAMNSDELPARDRNGRMEVWFGHEPGLIPEKPRSAPHPPRAAASREYLERALEHYRSALATNPESLIARLGHGWALEQAGDKPAAVQEYRRVIERAWPKEQSTKAAGLGQRFYTEEAARYLIPLLDPNRDAEEIADLRKRVDRLARLPRPITPIAVPLVDGATPSGVVDLEAQVPFDADGSGQRRRWTWISNAAGWLVYDAAQKGKISSALQWFGNTTFWLFWNNGYEALAALDDNADGELRGAELRYLAIWTDTNRNGFGDSGEVRPLAHHGIVAVSCRFTAGDGLLIAARSDVGVRLKDGRVRPTFDVILRQSITVSAPVP
jgi:tetratricopeptide (TPR) repeat protein